MDFMLKRLDLFDPKERPHSVLYHLARYRFVGRLLSKKDKVLDVGCGIGTGPHYLKDFCDTVTGIDIDSEAITKSNALYRTPQLQFCTMNAEDIDKSMLPSFNVITSVDNIEHLEYPEQFVKEAYELLPNKGMLICGTPRKQDLPARNKWHNHEFEADEFFKLLESHFPRVFRFGMNEETVSVFNVNTCWYLWGVGLKL